jgi:tetratricopeptide (TPR) repeat protein
LIAWRSGLLDDAEKYLRRSLELELRHDNQAGIASDCGNLGVLFLTKASRTNEALANLEAAESYLLRAIAADERLDNGRGLAEHLGNLGMVNSRRADFATIGTPQRRGLVDLARSQVSKALGHATQVGAKDIEANQYSNLGVISEDEGDMAAAVRYWTQAKEIYHALGITHEYEKLSAWIRAAK